MSSAISGAELGQFTDVISHESPSLQIQTGDLARYIVDGMAPSATIAPASLDQLQSVLREAHNAGIAVIPHGSGAHQGAGNLPAKYDAAVSLSRMEHIIAYEPADLTLTVEPGVTLRALQAELGAHGQRLPLDPANGGDATIGGVLAANAYGPMRHGYGTARDWLLGMRVVHADGTTTKSGGRVVKNVAGYDLHKLHVGALGSLGVIAEATFKVAPAPHVTRCISVQLTSPVQAARIVLAARDAGLALDAAELLSPTAAHAALNGSSWALMLVVAAGERTVERTLRELATLAADANSTLVEQSDDIWRRWGDAFAPAGLSLRVSIRPSDTGAAIEMLDRQLVGARALLSATVTAGLIRVQLADAGQRARTIFERTAQVAARFSGAVLVDAAPVALKRDIDVFGPLRPDFGIMQRLKQQFDPDGILSPGRFAGRL